MLTKWSAWWKASVELVFFVFAAKCGPHRPGCAGISTNDAENAQNWWNHSIGPMDRHGFYPVVPDAETKTANMSGSATFHEIQRASSGTLGRKRKLDGGTSGGHRLPMGTFTRVTR